MRASWLLVLGACGEGIFIEVRRPPDVAADRVELLVADELCSLGGDPCEGIQPQAFPMKVGDAEHIFFRDALDPFVGVYGDTDTVVFQLSPGAVTLPLVVAVGSVGSEITSVAVMKDIIDLTLNPVRYEAVLAAADPLTETGARPGSYAAVAWPDDRNTLDCFGVEGPEGLFFIVPDEDHDCDRVERECDPLWYLGVGPGSERCVTRNQNLGNACVAGGLACSEDPAVPEDGRCIPEPYCVPDELCDPACDRTDTSCLAGQLATAGIPRLKCTFRGEQADANLVQCANTRPVPLAPVVNVVSCPEPPRFVGLDDQVPTPFDVATESLDIGAASFHVSKHIADPCQTEVEFLGTAPLGFQTNLALEIVVGVGPEKRAMLVPATFEIQPDCKAPVGCVLEPASELDGVFNCAD
jgi:hypothetical protein